MSDRSGTKCRVWTNTDFQGEALSQLHSGLADAELVFATQTVSGNLVSSPPDPGLEDAVIAFGQPDVGQLFHLPKLRWVHLTSAGFTNYDRDDLRDSFKSRGIVLTNSSSVYAEPCAQHALAMILAFARQLPMAWAEQNTDRAWSDSAIRRKSTLLNNRNVMIYGFGAIARRLSELLKPLGLNVVGVRRRPTGKEQVPMVSLDEHKAWLSQADHVVNILPANGTTKDFFDREVLSLLKPTAYFYNIGRGVTVDQDFLGELLTSGKLAGAYLDVTNPEPLPTDHPLWRAPNCFITPHTAGGFSDEMLRLVQHFLANFDRFQLGQDLSDRVF